MQNKLSEIRADMARNDFVALRTHAIELSISCNSNLAVEKLLELATGCYQIGDVNLHTLMQIEAEIKKIQAKFGLTPIRAFDALAMVQGGN